MLTHATTWMNREDIMLNEISRKRTNTGFHLYEVPRIVKFVETESIMVVARSWE